MKHPTVTLTIDELQRAREVALGRGDRDARTAMAEKAASLCLYRSYDRGRWKKVEAWDTWKRLGVSVTGVTVQVSSSVVGELRAPPEADDGEVRVLVQERGEGQFAVVGWMLVKDMRVPGYESERGHVVPAADLRSAWELRKQRRSSGRRRHAADPADDWCGESRYPAKLDTDDGLHPKVYGQLVFSRWRLACRRCRGPIEPDQLSTWSLRTGSIHGEPADCVPEGSSAHKTRRSASGPQPTETDEAKR